MPRSTKKPLIEQRIRTMGEPTATARRCVGRGQFGLDACTPAQREFRTLMAMHLFNATESPSDDHWATWTTVSGITDYDITISPRYDELVIIAGAPRNIMAYLVPRSTNPEETRLPGLRLAQHVGPEYRLLHLRTGARLTVVSRRAATNPGGFHGTTTGAGRRRSALLQPKPEGWWTTDRPETEAEYDLMVEVPTPPDAIATILNALLVRLTARDPGGTWEMDYSSGLGRRERRLQGSGEHWTLRWTGKPGAAELRAMLEHEDTRLPGLLVESHGRGLDLILNGETLSINS